MIGKLKGRVDTISEDSAIVDVGGVGYLVFGSGRTLGLMPREGEAVELVIETHVREDHIHLYGFIDTMERDWFRLLTTVQGVGAKVALAILSAIEPSALSVAIAAGDHTMVTRANGVGPKLAQRIVTELKDKVPAFAASATIVPLKKGKKAAGTPEHNISEDALSALVNLGYNRSEAYAAVNEALRKLGGATKVEALIPAALKELA
ncbi:MAG: Holliday junction branch migration protein RuvA [Alphaproteobacteria bacterium]|nr:Holliday junction branch migration protein RuvA [Alphaproteobacteria bacterium]